MEALDRYAEIEKAARELVALLPSGTYTNEKIAEAKKRLEDALAKD